MKSAIMGTSVCFLVSLRSAIVGAVVLRGTELSNVGPTIPSFDSFLELHSRTYRAGSSEYGERRKIYEQRAESAKLQNSNPNRLWNAGINYLSDWNEAEMATLRGYRRGVHNGRDGSSGTYAISTSLNLLQNTSTNLPTDKLYTGLMATEHIYNQGACGSCWAIAGATILQAHAEIHKGLKRTFSAQQMVSCVPNPQECGGQGGCRGATVELAMDWVMANGLADESQVPYAAKDGTCNGANNHLVVAAKTPQAQATTTSFGMTGWEKLPENQYEPLMRALVEKGPVAVSSDASSWGSYDSGIFDGCALDAVVNHAITLVGYGEISAVKYWNIQNSWGQHWGEHGHIRLLRRDDDQTRCGIDRQPEMGTGCIGGPAQVTVCGMCGVLYDSVIPHFN